MRDLPKIDGDRLWDSLMQLAAIGAVGETGVCRLAASEEDRQARDLFAGWCREAGLDVRVDELGNMFARREGRDAARKPVLLGSHLDTQPVGGRFDGTFGVMAALETVRALDEAGIETLAPVEIVNWTNEEGCRFQPSSLGAEAAAGNIAAQDALAKRDDAGTSLGEALAAIGYRGGHTASLREAGFYLEAHIEQGPILENEGCDIGVVEGSMGIHGLTITLTGREAHTGTTPILARRDALYGAAIVIERVRELALAFEPDGRASVARIQAEPNARSVVAGRVTFTADCRHRDPGQLSIMLDRLRTMVREVADGLGLSWDMETYWQVPARRFDARCIDAVEQAVNGLGLRGRRLVSGAGHDAIPVAGVVPTAMIFVPSRGGISHHPDEYTTPEQLAAGCDVLLRATAHLAAIHREA